MISLFTKKIYEIFTIFTKDYFFLKVSLVYLGRPVVNHNLYFI